MREADRLLFIYDELDSHDVTSKYVEVDAVQNQVDWICYTENSPMPIAKSPIPFPLSAISTPWLIPEKGGHDIVFSSSIKASLFRSSDGTSYANVSVHHDLA